MEPKKISWLTNKSLLNDVSVEKRIITGLPIVTLRFFKKVSNNHNI